MLDRLETDQEEFWDENGAAFTETVRLAIRDTTEALLQEMPNTLRAELEGQLQWLKDFLAQEDRRPVSQASNRRNPPGSTRRIVN